MPALTCSPASTLSVESDTEDLSSDLGQELTPTVPRLKRISSTVQRPRAKKIAVSTAQIQPSSVDVKSFKFPVSPELKKYVKKGEPIPDNLRCELIRECVTCLKAQYGEAIPNDAFKMASKLICAEVPELADVQPPNWPEGVKFEYWVSNNVFSKVFEMDLMVHNNLAVPLNRGHISSISPKMDQYYRSMNLGSGFIFQGKVRIPIQEEALG